MFEITCNRSGLTFTADSRRKKVHPQISQWLNSKDLKIRYAAIEVIGLGQSEGWTTYEKFEEEIQKALQPPAPPEYNITVSDTGSKSYQKKKGWIARIVGQCETYGYKREFIEPVDRTGRDRHYNLTGDGIYECCSYSSSGNKYLSYYQVTNGQLTEIQKEEMIAIIGEPIATKKKEAKETLISKDEVSSQIVEECWECGATYTTFGNVEWGGMGCRRCG